MYELIGHKNTRALRVLWMLEELGVDYTHKPEAPHSELVSQLNPNGKIPVLRSEGHVIRDSTAILTYLADKHGKFTAPAGTLERADQDSITHLILDEIDAILWTAARHSFILPEQHRVPEVKPSLQWEFFKNMSNLSKRMKGPFVMGNEMSIVDIILTHCLNWAYVAKFMIDDRDVLDYGKRMRARPAYQRASTA